MGKRNEGEGEGMPSPSIEHSVEGKEKGKGKERRKRKGILISLKKKKKKQIGYVRKRICDDFIDNRVNICAFSVGRRLQIWRRVSGSVLT